MKKIISCSYLLLCSFILISCSAKTEKTETASSQTVYIGDNSKVSQLVSDLDYPSGLTYDSIEIQSDEEPYELKVFVSGTTDYYDELEKCADEAFERISNMDVIHFYHKDSGELLATYLR
ncbi:hypothetical protein ABID29_000041 [Streptococcus rupicaprae]|uniref:DUF4825 domain-containing protein n=1 Tax=Streptococcus rupicaprae TaxID=759619 RepID=A0ABV2FED5_9STRE